MATDNINIKKATRGGARKGSGRKTRKEEIMDVELHKKASTYLCNNFHKFSDDKKLDISIKILNKFGVSTIQNDVTVQRLDDNQYKVLESHQNRLLKVINE